MNLTPDINPEKAWEPFEPSAANPWSKRLAAHLYRRAGFGGSINDIVQAQQDGLKSTLEKLTNFQSAISYDEEMSASGRLVTGGLDSKGLASWWLLRMAQTPCPLQEKMTLFWHGHFATGADKVGDGRAMLRQNQLLRQSAHGHLEPLVRKLSRDVAMLVYLDSTENRKTRPNENYARELMELFCLGPGNYTEKDIKEIARCFTGWEVRKNKFKFNSYQHDEGTKSFLGSSGKYNGDDAIRIILQQPAAGTFIAKKLIRFFVVEDLVISDALAEPIAADLRTSGFDIGRVVRKILSSNIFFSEIAIAKKIKSPVELAIGALRFFDGSVNMTQLANRLQRLGQLPLYPPNVKGWEGGRTWINAATILARANLIDAMITNSKTTFGGRKLKDWLGKQAKQGVGESFEWVNDFILAEPLSATAQSSFETQFKKSPATALSWLAALPEFQLN